MVLLLSLGFATTPCPAEIKTIDQWIDLGWDYFNIGDTEEAFNTFLLAIEQYPDSAIAHLSLGEMYLELGEIERGRTEILESLRYDDESPIASMAHYRYACSIREEETCQALLHLNRAYRLGGTPTHLFEIANQVRFCNLLLQMTGRSERGGVILHYPEYMILQDTGDNLALKAEESLYLAETFCYFDMSEPVHFFLYPSERAIRAKVWLEEDEWDPKHREFHFIYNQDLDLLAPLGVQVVSDLQDEMNLHGGSDWVTRGLPVAVTGLASWEYPGSREEDTCVYIECDNAVRGLVDQSLLIGLHYIVTQEFEEHIPSSVGNAEIGSLLRWVRRAYPKEIFLKLLTQQNLEIVFDTSVDEIQTAWLDEIINTPNLIADPELGAEWADDQPISPLSGDPDLQVDILKEGLRMYLNGDVANGMWKIRHALQINPGLALGYYILGWIQYMEDDWEEAEEQLEMAILLFNRPEEIAWCHVMLAPIYLEDHRWNLAHASLGVVAAYSDSEEKRAWASELVSRVGHIISLQPASQNRDSVEFDQMRIFFSEWNQSANSENGVRLLASDMMDEMRMESISGFYSSIRNRYPTVVFNHAVQAAEAVDSAIYVEVHVQAAFPNSYVRLPAELKPLVEGGYLLFFQAVETEDGYRVFDWEDGSFPLSSFRFLIPEEIEVDPVVQDTSF